jgi:hypothetical protein
METDSVGAAVTKLSLDVADAGAANNANFNGENPTKKKKRIQPLLISNDNRD